MAVDTFLYQHIGDTAPTVSLCGLRVNDYWLDTTSGILKKCTAISPAVTWENKTSAGGGLSITEIKADTDIADSLTKKHANTLDHSNSLDHFNSLDHNGGTQDSAIAGKEPANANIQIHVTTSHAPADAQKNSEILKAEIEAVLTGQIASHTHAGGGGEAFPVGSVFLAVVATNPATLLGYGTWSQIAQGKFIVGQDATDPVFDIAEETGGAKTHTLDLTEIPAHSHILRRHATTTGALTGITTAPDTSSSGPADAGPQSGIVGGGGAHNNLPPYFVIYIWKRTA